MTENSSELPSAHDRADGTVERGGGVDHAAAIGVQEIDGGASDGTVEAALHAHAPAVLDTLAMMTEPPTDDPTVNDIVRLLTQVPGLPVSDHPAVFDEIQRALHERLADAEQ